jgi:hypothetical protein
MKPTASQISKFKRSDEFYELSKKEFAGRHDLYEHLSDSDWDAYEAARDEHSWKCDIIDDLKAKAKAECQKLRDAEGIAFAADPNIYLRFAAAQDNAYDTANIEKVFEVDSLAFFECCIGSYGELSNA